MNAQKVLKVQGRILYQKDLVHIRDLIQNNPYYSAIGYIAPQDKLLGREKEIFSERDRKLSEARQRRAAKRKIA